jgi:hypothetical protein
VHALAPSTPPFFKNLQKEREDKNEKGEKKMREDGLLK